MRCAVCFYGHIGRLKGRTKGDLVPWHLCYENINKHIVIPNKADVFCHCWNLDRMHAMRRKINPVDGIWEKPFTFKAPTRDERSGRSRWYSTKQAIELKKAHEEKKGFKYDWVFLTRYDVWFHRNIVMNGFDNNAFYASNFNICPYEDPSVSPVMLEVKNKDNVSTEKSCLQDLWFFSNSENMDKFGTCFDQLGKTIGGKTLLSPHKTAYAHVKRAIGVDKVKYVFRRHYDYDLYRYIEAGSKKII